jgi:hypothetical protein
MIFLLLPPPALYVYASATLLTAFALVRLGHRVLGLLRDWRNFRNGQ